jgi:hypothetical protein
MAMTCELFEIMFEQVDTSKLILFIIINFCSNENVWIV